MSRDLADPGEERITRNYFERCQACSAGEGVPAVAAGSTRGDPEGGALPEPGASADRTERETATKALAKDDDVSLDIEVFESEQGSESAEARNRLIED